LDAPIKTALLESILIAVPDPLAVVIPSTPPAGRLVSDAPDIAGRAPVKFPEVKEVSDAPDIAGRAPVNRLDVMVSAVV
jgi:hypothetical protein